MRPYNYPVMGRALIGPPLIFSLKSSWNPFPCGASQCVFLILCTWIHQSINQVIGLDPTVDHQHLVGLSIDKHNPTIATLDCLSSRWYTSKLLDLISTS